MKQVARVLIRFEARDETWERYHHRFGEMGGIAAGEGVRSPSVQYRISSGRVVYRLDQRQISTGQSPVRVGLIPDDLTDIALNNELHFDAADQQGVVFYLIGALSEFGKLGTIRIGDNRESARKLYRDTVAILDREARQTP